MQITKLEYQKKNTDRANVYVDGKFAVGLNVNDIIKLGLTNGQEITQTELNKIIENSNFGKAFNAALNFLSFRPRSEFEVRQYLQKRIKNYELRIKQKKHNSDYIIHNSGDVDRVIDRLKEIGQIDDEAFARWWVEQRNAFRPKGKRALEMELRRKGVKVKIEVENEQDLAMKALKKKLPMPPEKIFRYLAGRGFGYDTIESVIEKLGLKE